jgi:Na+/H+ antiporter NhaD/arsenite permease-like protein
VRWVILSLFALTYAGISARRVALLPIGRPALALVGATALVIAGHFAGPHGLSPDAALRAVEPNTIALLVAMMIVSAAMGEAGFFDRATDALATRVRSPAALLYAVTFGAGLLSAVLVNDAVCVLATPLVVRLARRLGASVRPLLFAVAMGSNAGSALTLGGDPQNMLVARLSGLSYRGYLAHADLLLAPVISLGSQVVSNVPLILLLEPWIRTFPDADHAWTVTALVSTLAGNLTLLGSVANVIVFEQARTRVGFVEYLRVGVPVTVASTVLALGLLKLQG